jgi:hypothetical protein
MRVVGRSGAENALWIYRKAESVDESNCGCAPAQNANLHFKAQSVDAPRPCVKGTSPNLQLTAQCVDDKQLFIYTYEHNV